ncbi:MAG: cytochrome c biogenesis protein CcsA [Fimbriimonadales bacterium]
MTRPANILLLLAMAGATVASFLAPPAKGFQQPDLARIIFFHLPCAFAATAFLFFGAFAAIRSLSADRLLWDARAEAAHGMAAAMAIATMLSGILFSKVQWGAWWQNDPRQTSFLLVLLILGAYFAIRAAFQDPERRARNSAAYSVGSLLPNLFLIFVFPRLPQVSTFHPEVIGKEGGFDPTYWRTILAVFACLMVVAIWAYRMRVRAILLEERLEQLDAELDSRQRHSADRVVRAVRLPEPDESPRG